MLRRAPSLRNAPILLTLLLAFETRAIAAEDVPRRLDPAGVEASDGHWYGWQIMLSDLGAIGALAGGLALTANSTHFVFMPVAGGVGYVAGGPTVHGVHGNGALAGRSLLLRLLVPLGGAVLGIGVGALTDAASHGDDCQHCGKIIFGIGGVGVGMVAAMIADWATARDLVHPIPRSSAPESVWAPVLVLGPRGGSAGLSVRF